MLGKIITTPKWQTKNKKTSKQTDIFNKLNIASQLATTCTLYSQALIGKVSCWFLYISLCNLASCTLCKYIKECFIYYSSLFYVIVALWTTSKWWPGAENNRCWRRTGRNRKRTGTNMEQTENCSFNFERKGKKAVWSNVFSKLTKKWINVFRL